MKVPACGQCTRLNYHCPGYDSGVVFIHDARSIQATQKSLATRKTSSVLVSKSSSSLLQGAMQLGFSDHFWYLYLPRKSVLPESPQGRLDGLFLAVEAITADDVVSRHAFRALSAFIIGHEISDNSLLVQGRSMYGQALKALRTEISNVKNGRTEASAGMALTCNLLALYEIFDDPDQIRLGFFQHGQGLTKLVQLRGPEAFCSGISLAAFHGIRIAIIFTALRARQSTFLSSSDWCTIPWKTQPKPAWQRVNDVVALLPGLLERIDIFKTSPFHFEDTNHELSLVNHCWFIHDEIQGLQKELAMLFELESFNQIWQMKRNTIQKYPFGIEVHFRDQSQSMAMLFYWALYVHFYFNMQELKKVKDWAILENTNPQQHQLFPSVPGLITEAILIVQSIPYFLQPSLGLLMRKLFAIPMAIAYAYFTSLIQNSRSQSSANHMAACESENVEARSTLTVADLHNILLYLENTAKSMRISRFQIASFRLSTDPQFSIMLTSSPGR